MPERERKKTLYVGTFIHSKDPKHLEYLQDKILGVDEKGKIAFIDQGREQHVKYIAKKHGWTDYAVVEANDKQFFFPGFIDTHIHAPQYPNCGIFGDLDLLNWLKRYTFPMESSLSDLEVAERVYRRCVTRTLLHGTTTAAYFATIDVAATNLLADICHGWGQRALIGRCCMDCMSPKDYKDSSPEASVKATEATIAHIKEIDPDYEIVRPAITPRFALSCSSDCLYLLGELSRRTKLPIQTHISENIAEVEEVRRVFPTAASYAGVYAELGILSPRTILAHGIHLSDSEVELIQRHRAKISHCPLSNSALSSGAAKVRRLLNAGITVGLGTDVSGGYSPSILEAMRQACLVSHHVAMNDGDEAKLSLPELIYMATKGGAEVVGLADKVGCFKVGMAWDAQLVELGYVSEKGPDKMYDETRPVDIFGWEALEDRVTKWVFTGDDRNTVAVWINGKRVVG